MPPVADSRQPPIRVVLLCSDPGLAQQVETILEDVADLRTARSAGVPAAGIRSRESRDDIFVIEDVWFRQHRQKCPPEPTVLLCDPGSDQLVKIALRAGVCGCLEKRAIRSQLARALRAVYAGEIWASRRLLTEALRDPRLDVGAYPGTGSKLNLLSRRERQVMDLVGAGMSNKQIGSSLNISDTTVKAHLRHIFRKLGIRRRFDILVGGANNVVTADQPRVSDTENR